MQVEDLRLLMVPQIKRPYKRSREHPQFARLLSTVHFVSTAVYCKMVEALSDVPFRMFFLVFRPFNGS